MPSDPIATIASVPPPPEDSTDEDLPLWQFAAKRIRPSVLVYGKHLDARFTGTGAADSLIVVANVDPHSVRETIVHLDLTRFGLEPDDGFTVTELISGAEWAWSRDNYVRLDAFTEPVHVLAIQHGTVKHRPSGRTV